MSARPSNVGTRFHNYLYEQLGLDFVYKAFAPSDIAAAVSGIRGLGIRGAAVSMPFKQAVIPLIDAVDDTASVINAVNTIVNTDGYLRGFNTDFIAVRQLLSDAAIDPDATVLVLGSGGMARAVIAAVKDVGLRNVFIHARNATAATELATQYTAHIAKAPEALRPNVIINATPIGMAGGAESSQLPIQEAVVASAQVVFDVVAMPVRTPLIQMASAMGKQVITGREVMTLQAVEQFVLYTGVRPPADLIAAAAEFANA